MVDEPAAATVEALERQTRTPDELAVAGRGLPAAEWFWLLDGMAVPEPTALGRLLEALDRLGPLPSPVLLASKVVTPDGSPEHGSVPVPRVKDPDLTAAAFEQRLLPIRVARRGSLLVHRRGVEERGLPRDDLRWSARLLKRELGLLVPWSVAVRPPRPPRRELLGWLALLLSDALETGEKPWFAFRLAEDALVRASESPSGNRRVTGRGWQVRRRSQCKSIGEHGGRSQARPGAAETGRD